MGGATVGYQLNAYRNDYMYNVWYDFALLPVIGVGMFLVLTRVRMTARVQHIVTSLATASFGIYLLHYPIAQLLQRYLVETTYPAVNLILQTIITYLLSWLLVALAGKIRLGRKLFLIK